MTTDYLPIDCDQHSVLELLAMRRAPVRAIYQDSTAAPRQTTGIVVDVLTRERAEFLVLAVGAEQLSVRLDHLQAIYIGTDRVFPVESPA